MGPRRQALYGGRASVTRGVPPGWPAEVPPPDVPGWEQRAAGWLFDLCPADLRAHAVLRRHPAALAYVADAQVSAALAAVLDSPVRGAGGAARGPAARRR